MAKGEDILQVLEVKLAIFLMDNLDLDPDRAKEAARIFIGDVKDSYGGVRWMFKRGYRSITPEMKADITREFTGSNWRIICDRYKISRSYLYTVVRKSA